MPPSSPMTHEGVKRAHHTFDSGVCPATKMVHDSTSTKDEVLPAAATSTRIPPSSPVAYEGGKRVHHTFDSGTSTAMKMLHDSTSTGRAIDDVLPEAMLMEIMSRLPDARDLARCGSVNNIFRSSSRHVKWVSFHCSSFQSLNVRQGDMVPFKETVVITLERLQSVERLRLEIGDDMQANRKEDDTDRTSLWLSEPSFITKWLPPVSETLQNLTIIDYGQKAIFRATPLLQMLSTQCKQLRTLELRNMFLDCREISENLNKVSTLTLRCVKLTEHGLSDLNKCMPALETLTLVTVVGLKEAVFTSKNLKVLCLGLATKVNSVRLKVEHLVKLQLKMACPDRLEVDAPDLKCLAVCMDKREKKVVKFENVKRLRELLMGASEFATLTDLSSSNSYLEKVFLDVPCMGFEDNGGFKAVLDVPFALPDMEGIRSCCPNLHTLSVGPGLWYSLCNSYKEAYSSENGTTLPKWPILRRLILHMIVTQDVERSMGLLTALVRAIPTLAILEVYVHTDSVVQAQEFYQLKSQFPSLELKCDSWRKGLRFDCFSF